MTESNFLLSFQKAIASSNEKETNIREIHNLILDLGEEIKNGTDGLIIISLKEWVNTIKAFAAMDFGKSKPNSNISNDLKEFYLEVANSRSKKVFNMADVIFGDKGYPITLKFNNTSLTSSSKEGLQEDLNFILQSASFGDGLRSIN